MGKENPFGGCDNIRDLPELSVGSTLDQDSLARQILIEILSQRGRGYERRLHGGSRLVERVGGQVVDLVAGVGSFTLLLPHILKGTVGKVFDEMSPQENYIQTVN